MIDALFNKPSYMAAQKMLDATVLRHQAIASNIANVETPNYKRLDVDASFGTELNRALAGGNTGALRSLKPTLVVDPNATAANRDGNTVQIEHELLQLSQNQVAHTLETQLITGSLLRLRLAITGRPV